MILSSKRNIPKSLSIIEEGSEAQGSQAVRALFYFAISLSQSSCDIKLPTISSFRYLRSLTKLVSSSRIHVTEHISSATLCAVKSFSKSSISYETPALERAMKEQMMLRLLTQMDVRFVLKLRWSFQNKEAMHLVTVRRRSICSQQRVDGL